MPYSNWHNKAALAWVLVLVLVSICLGLMWWQHKLSLQSDVFSLLPKQQQSAAVADAKEHMDQLLNRRLFVMVSSPSAEQLQQDSATILARFQASPLWQSAPLAWDTTTLGRTLFAHKSGLLNPEDIAHLQAGQYAAVTEAAMMQWLSPAMPISDTLLQQDPLLLFPRYLMGLQAAQDNETQIQDGFPSREANQRYHRLLVIHLAASPFDIDYQQRTTPWLQHLLQDYPPNASTSHINMTGTLVYASAGTQAAKHEVSTIGLGSSLGVMLLVWFGFRSFRPLATELAAVSSGCVVALLATQLVFGEVHVMTTVFGASLIGASVDFSFYYLFMQAHQRGQTGRQVMHTMLPDLFVGLLTTLAAYMCLLLTPFPGLRQIAVFSMAGLSAAWLTSMLLLPYLPALNTHTASHHLRFLALWRGHFLQHPKWRWAIVAASLLFAAVCLPQLRSNDDVHSLQAADPFWQQQAAAIKTVFGQQQATQYFVVTGNSEAETARNEAQLLQVLQQAQTQGEIDAFQALGSVLPSTEQQLANKTLLQRIPHPMLQTHAQQLGIDMAQLLHWQQQLASTPLLSWQDLQAHPASQLRVNEHIRIVLPSHIQQETALRAQLQTLKHTTWVHPAADLSQLFQTYRIQSTWRLSFGLMGLGILLACLYGWRVVFGLVAPVTLALLTTFSLQAALGLEINLFSIMAAFLVLGIGVDYAIFYHHTEQRTPVVSYALCLCMLAAILGFGLLAFSHTQAISAFGTTVLLGVICSYFYANILTLPAPNTAQKEDGP